MWSAGIAWDNQGYEVVCMHRTGSVLPARRFTADAVVPLADYLRNMCGALPIAVIDSLNGLLAEPLRSAGVRVLQVASRDIAARTRSARDLAEQFHLQSGASFRTGIAETSLAGQRDAVRLAIASSAAYEKQLARAGRWLRKGSQAHREIALTFDDGPCLPYTDQVLDILSDYGVPATFFCVGLHVHAMPDAVARMQEEGHAVANHTWSHPDLLSLTPDELHFQTEATSRAIARVTGEPPTLFRPPFGNRSPEVLRWIADEGMTTVLWDTDTKDWRRPGSDTIAAVAVGRAGPGSVVLMHDGGGDRSQTVSALRPVIEGLLADGYRLVTADSLLTPANN